MRLESVMCLTPMVSLDMTGTPSEADRRSGPPPPALGLAEPGYRHHSGKRAPESRVMDTIMSAR